MRLPSTRFLCLVDNTIDTENKSYRIAVAEHRLRRAQEIAERIVEAAERELCEARRYWRERKPRTKAEIQEFKDAGIRFRRNPGIIGY